MTRKQSRIFSVIIVLLGASMAVGLSLYALKDNVTYFYAPSDLQKEIPERIFRLGGMVKDGSLRREGSVVHFTITDYKAEIRVIYDGIPPDLFREGQGVIATGKINENGMFIAQTLLAKHDENYMPPEVKKALEKTHNK
ncbi:MAG: cytochrome c maturation protein CcmE [Alphaproteobacteria bacterium]|nr:cytochrome c maturation protein CcmE [Alphaproteobacteria bacterium]